jgi:23S rRNA pseudouridine1911/1915/1917 synthase
LHFIMPTYIISKKESGRTVLEVLRSRLRLSGARARRLVQGLQIRLDGAVCRDAARRVKAGQRLQVREAGQAAPPKKVGGPVICFADKHLVVVDKPAGLTTMRHPEEAAEFGERGRRFLPPTLADLLPGLLAQAGKGKPGRVRAVHRLDKETSGLLVFARTPEAESHLGKQFRAHSIERRYLALVRGRARPGRIESVLVRDRGDGRRGSTAEPGQGQRAITHVRVVEDLGAYTLVECRLETGRTHQVRIHLAESSTPLCGERVYDRPLHGKPLPDHSGARRPALHAASLGLQHPHTGQWLAWQSEPPADLKTLLKRVRRGSQQADQPEQ